MAQAYGDDLRRKFLSAYDQGEETLEELAGRFLVSVGWAKKISAQRNRSGQAERIRHQPGRKPHADLQALHKNLVKLLYFRVNGSTITAPGYAVNRQEIPVA